MEMNLRDWLADLTKFRGIVRVNLKKLSTMLGAFTREDGTVEPIRRHRQKAFTVISDGTVAATHTFGPVASGKYWILKRGIHINANRNTRGIVTIGGVTIASNGQQDAIPLGIEGQLDLLDLRLNAGGTVEITDLSFVALDVVASNLVYEEYDA